MFGGIMFVSVICDNFLQKGRTYGIIVNHNVRL